MLFVGDLFFSRDLLDILRPMAEFPGKVPLHLQLRADSPESRPDGEVVMGQVMRDIAKPVHHHGEHLVAVTRWHLMAGIQRDHVCRGERWELGIDRRSLAGPKSQVIGKVRKVVFIREFQEHTPGIWSEGVKQHREQEVPSRLGIVPGVRRIDAFVILVVPRSDEGVGVSDELSDEAGALNRRPRSECVARFGHCRSPLAHRERVVGIGHQDITPFLPLLQALRFAAGFCLLPVLMLALHPFEFFIWLWRRRPLVQNPTEEPVLFQICANSIKLRRNPAASNPGVNPRKQRNRVPVRLAFVHKGCLDPEPIRLG